MGDGSRGEAPGEILFRRSNKVFYRDGDALIKVFNSEFSMADVLNEALSLARVSEMGLPVPRVREVVRYGKEWAIVTDYIAGETFQSKIDRNPENFTGLMTQFVKLQRYVHSFEAPMLNRIRDKINRKISETDLTATMRYELHTRVANMPGTNRLIHGDFTPGNVIARPDGSMVILDWSHCTQGDPQADCAGTYLRYILAGNFEQGDTYLKIFLEQTGFSKEAVMEWLPLMAVSRLPGARTPQERQKLLDIINH